MFDVHNFPRHRNTGRGPSLPNHVVSLFKDGRKVGQFTFPATDTRFVKDRELFEIAFQQIKHREQFSTSGSKDPKPGSWDMFGISFYFIDMFGNTAGERIRMGDDIVA